MGTFAWIAVGAAGMFVVLATIGVVIEKSNKTKEVPASAS